jgi:hypothetical protein
MFKKNLLPPSLEVESYCDTVQPGTYLSVFSEELDVF